MGKKQGLKRSAASLEKQQNAGVMMQACPHKGSNTGWQAPNIVNVTSRHNPAQRLGRAC
jgi:hypothetical protein